MSATGRGKARAANDYYPTPDWLTRAIIPVIKDRFPQGLVTILEPACGAGAIVHELEIAFPTAETVGFDIRQGVDFLTEQPIPRFDLVITNPPYLLAQEFVDRARPWLRPPSGGCVPLIVMLLRVNFTGSCKRADWLLADMPSFYVLSPRPSFGTNKDGRPGKDATEYAWVDMAGGCRTHVGTLEVVTGHGKARDPNNSAHAAAANNGGGTSMRFEDDG